MNISRLSFALLALFSSTAFADNITNALEESSSIELPSLEAAACYRTMKVERGMVENKDSVFGYEAELGWYGLFAGLEACYDMTDIEGRKGRFNEIESVAGYSHAFGALSASVAYVYKACAGDEPDTQEVELGVEYETPWATPFVELATDVKEKPGALYGCAGLHREWEFCECTRLVTCGGLGFGNAYRNDGDFGSDRCAFRDIHVGAELEIDLCPHLKLVPSVDFYDAFTSDQRHEYDKFNGFFCVAGCHLAAEF